MSIRTLVLVVLVALCATAASAATWDAVGDWAAANPNGAWTYNWCEDVLVSGYTVSLVTDFADYSPSPYPGLQEWNIDDTIAEDGYAPQFVCNTGDTNYISDIFLAHSLCIHPGPYSGVHDYGVLRWTAPSAGVYQIDAGFFYTPHDPSTDVHVFKNGTSLVDGLINTESLEVVYGGVLNLAQGDTIDLAVGPDGSYVHDTTRISCQITTVPEPGSVLALLCGMAGLGGAMLRRKRA